VVADEDTLVGSPTEPLRASVAPPRTTLAARLLEQTQDIVSVLTGVLLILLAAAVLLSAVVSFFQDIAGNSSFVNAATGFLDRALLALILVEIVHTVRLSLRAHSLLPEPFIVVGLVAVIRRLLFLLANGQPVRVSELALLIAMVVVFVLGLVVVRRWGGAPRV
jgi:uncharacterized membrane protein (DUF373 family)